MSKKYLKRQVLFVPCGEALLKYAIVVIIFLITLNILTTSVLAELPAPADLENVPFDLGIYFIRPNSKYVVPTSAQDQFLSVDSANFIACTEEDSVPAGYVVCADNNNFKEVTLYPWPGQDNCYVGGAALSDFDCENALIEVEYQVGDENLKLSQEFTINTFSTVVEKLINSQYSDGGWIEPLDTSFAILGLSHFKEIFNFEIDKALQWLKLNRNNEQKCWPESPCNLQETARILTILTDSDINDSYRIINDGRNYLEERQTYYKQGDQWTVDVTDVAVGSTLSIVAIGDELLDENFSLPPNGTKSYNFSAYQDDELIIIADADVEVEIFDQRGYSLYQFQGDNLSYTVPGACWSLNFAGEPCSPQTTVLASSADLPSFRLDEAKTYMKTQIHPGIVKKYYGTSNDPVYSSLYAKLFYDKAQLDSEDAAKEDQDGSYLYDVLQWVLFKQNNDGYWGDEFDGDVDDDTYETDKSRAITEQLKTTALVSMGLLDAGFNRTSENLVDAKKWVSSIEDDINQSSGAALGAAMYIVQNNAYPLLYANPEVIVIDSQTKDISLVNPTPFEYRDLSFTLSPSIVNVLSVDEKTSLGAFKYRNVKFTKKNAAVINVAGFLSVANANQEIARIPVVIQDAPSLEVTLEDKISVFGKSGQVKLTAKRSAHSFKCTVDWDDNDLSSPGFTISSNSAQVKLNFDEAQTEEDVYTGSIKCTSAGQEFSFPVALQVSQFIDRPLTVFPKSVLFNDSQSKSILIKNNLDVDVIASVSLDNYENELVIPQDVFLEPGTSQNITVKTNFDPLLNYTGSARLSVSTLDTQETVSIIVDVTSNPRSSAGIVTLIIVLTFMLILLGTGGYFAYKYRDDLLVYINKIPLFQSKEEIKKKKESLTGLRSEERNKAIVNMYTIMKFQEATDQEIKKRLVGTFSKDEIASALDEQGIILETLEEGEPEKV